LLTRLVQAVAAIDTDRAEQIARTITRPYVQARALVEVALGAGR
jgi:hypothetical protein